MDVAFGLIVDDLGTLVEIFMRLISALFMTGAAILVWQRLWVGRLRPRAVWVHIAVVLTVVAHYRWFVAGLLLLPPNTDVSTLYYVQWVQPMNQAMYVLLAISAILMAIVGSRTREDS